MPDIPEITGVNIDIRDIKIDAITTYRYTLPAIPTAPPVTLDIGVPVVDIPGCVEAHESNSKSKEIGNDDEQGLVTYCDAGVPSFSPIDYNKNKLKITRPPTVAPKLDSPDAPEAEVPEAEVPKTPDASSANVECPTKVQQAQEPVGTLVEGFRKRVTGYELIDNTCVQITEDVGLPTQIIAGLPSGGQVVQVGGIAVVATTSALLAKPLADILLKAVKPTVKKVIKKIAAIRGKKPPVKSSGERRAEQRQMNHAVKALRSVFPRRKKKGRG